MAGERDKLLASFAAHRSALTRFFLHRLGNAATAEDLTQETWLRAAGVDGAVAIDNPRSYIFRIAANLAVDHRRRKSQQAEEPWIGEALAAMPDPAPTPETIVLHRSELERLTRIVDGLSPRCREVFCLARIDGLNYREIGDRLGIARSTVITHMITAMRVLERGLGDERAENSPQDSAKIRRRPL